MNKAYNATMIAEAVGDFLADTLNLEKAAEVRRNMTHYWQLGINRDVCVSITLANQRDARVIVYDYQKNYNIDNGIQAHITREVRLDVLCGEMEDVPAIHSIISSIIKK
jgi:hypothetical protein